MLFNRLINRADPLGPGHHAVVSILITEIEFFSGDFVHIAFLFFTALHFGPADKLSRSIGPWSSRDFSIAISMSTVPRTTTERVPVCGGRFLFLRLEFNRLHSSLKNEQKYRHKSYVTISSFHKGNG